MEIKSLNKNLRKASKAKKDEFYTQLSDIEKELRHYKDQFRNKVVYCNCDDPFESNFFKYFAANFNALGLKKLITTSYDQSSIAGGQLPLLEIEGLKPKGKQPFKIEISEVPDNNTDGAIDLTDVEWLLKQDANASTPLKEDGDFRSKECVELLKQADIVVTNPPFSLFREYLTQLMEHKKKFLILGNKNAITYKEIFKLIKENKLWTGMMPMGYDILFLVPESYARKMVESGKLGSQYKIINGIVYGRSPSIWFTNLDTSKRHENIVLYKRYSSEEFPKYDNYDAINVDKVSEIPMDYTGVMGVPITFIDKYNPDQFELLGIMNTGETNKGIRYEGTPHGRPLVKGVEKYLRILIRAKANHEN